MSQIAIVTDSTSDIPAALADQMGIYIVPNLLVIEDQEVEDGRGISRQEFYERLPAMKTQPTTATASSGAYQLLYENLFSQGYTSIISIHTSSLLSGIINAANTAAQAFDGRVHVIDSQSVSLGLGFQVLTAAHNALSQPIETVLALLAEIHQHVRVMAMLDTLEYLRRSGRVSWARARLGDFLNIKPIIEVRAGKVHSLGETRTRRKGIDQLLHLLEGCGPLEKLAILHTNAASDAQMILDKLQQQISSTPLIIHVTTIIGTHVGPNGLGFAALLKW